MKWYFTITLCQVQKYACNKQLVESVKDHLLNFVLCIVYKKYRKCIAVLYCNEHALFCHEICCCGNDQALSHEVTELKNEKMKVQSGLVTSSDAELAAEKKVKHPSQIC